MLNSILLKKCWFFFKLTKKNGLPIAFLFLFFNEKNTSYNRSYAKKNVCTTQYSIFYFFYAYCHSLFVILVSVEDSSWWHSSGSFGYSTKFEVFRYNTLLKMSIKNYRNALFVWKNKHYNVSSAIVIADKKFHF